jgi:hypothetical protein
MKIAIWILALLAMGCADVKPVQAAAETLDVLKGRPLTIVTYTAPDFAAFTAGRAAFGMFGLIGGLAGAATMQADGNTIVRENAIPDPAIEIAAKLTAHFSEILQPSATARIADRPTKLDSVANLSRDAGKDQTVLDVKTEGWMFMYLPFSSHYRVIYSGEARLIDAVSAKWVARASCTYRSDEKTPPTYDQLLENKAALLKTMLAAAADTCAGEMAQSLSAP